VVSIRCKFFLPAVATALQLGFAPVEMEMEFSEPVLMKQQRLVRQSDSQVAQICQVIDHSAAISCSIYSFLQISGENQRAENVRTTILQYYYCTTNYIL
jgi:hypothetical protein